MRLNGLAMKEKKHSLSNQIEVYRETYICCKTNSYRKEKIELPSIRVTSESP